MISNVCTGQGVKMLLIGIGNTYVLNKAVEGGLRGYRGERGGCGQNVK